METKAVSIESVTKSGELMRFVAYTDPVAMTGYELVQQAITGANGKAELTATPPVGKTLIATVHIVEGGVARSRFRVLTDNF